MIVRVPGDTIENMLRTHMKYAVLISTFVTGTVIGFAQGPGMARPSTPSTPPKDPTGGLKTGDMSSTSEAVARGQVALADGTVPERLVQIYAVCGGDQKFLAVADAKGRFSFNPRALSDTPATKDCVLRATLEGYRSETKPLADVKPDSSTKLGKILLQPLSADTTGLTSQTGAQANKAAKKAYEKALDEAAKQAWPEAKAALLKATSAYPGYSNAWLSLGILQQSEGDRDGAQKSFAEGVRADEKFAAPLISLAALDALRGDWQATVEHSQKAIDLNPSAFPQAYELNALGNLNLRKVDAVEKSAAEGLKLDTEHRYPELEYLLGIVLAAKRDLDGATKHLQAYIDQSPNGPNVGRAKTALGELRAGK
jgi:tetratricopeptide (TPR) repeat protein